MLCPNCGKELKGERCGGCGYDRSRDLLRFPTLTPAGPAESAGLVTSGEWKRREAMFAAALELENAAASEAGFNAAARLFDQLEELGYPGSGDHARSCREKAFALEAPQEDPPPGPDVEISGEELLDQADRQRRKMAELRSHSRKEAPPDGPSPAMPDIWWLDGSGSFPGRPPAPPKPPKPPLGKRLETVFPSPSAPQPTPAPTPEAAPAPAPQPASPPVRQAPCSRPSAADRDEIKTKIVKMALVLCLAAVIILLAVYFWNVNQSSGVMTFGEYLAAEPDSHVVIETYVQAKQTWQDGRTSLYTQDRDGAYFLYDLACSEEEYAKMVPGKKLRVSGFKSEWSGETEIVDATFVFEPGKYIAKALDVTKLLGTDDLIRHQNKLVSFKGLIVEPSQDRDGSVASFLYGWDGSGSVGDDLYFNASMEGEVFTFTVESSLCGKGTSVYQAVQNLSIGDTVDLEGFLYWYEGPNPHITGIRRTDGSSAEGAVEEISVTLEHLQGTWRREDDGATAEITCKGDQYEYAVMYADGGLEYHAGTASLMEDTVHLEGTAQMLRWNAETDGKAYTEELTDREEPVAALSRTRLTLSKGGPFTRVPGESVLPYVKDILAQREADRAKLLENITRFASDADYENALAAVRSAIRQVGSDSELRMLEAQYTETFCSYILQKAENEFKERRAEEAVRIIHLGQAVISDSRLDAMEVQYQNYIPVPIGDLRLVSQSRIREYNGLSRADTVTDGHGKEYAGPCYYSDYRSAILNGWGPFYTHMYNVYLTDGQYQSLNAVIVLPEKQYDTRMKTDIRIFGDGKELYVSPQIGAGFLSLEISVDITGVTELRIEMGCGEYDTLDDQFSLEPYLCNPTVSRYPAE